MSLNMLRKYSTQFFQTKSIVFFGAIFFVICIVIIVTGLWPFNFKPVNKVAWLSDRNGINFYGQGMIISSDVWSKDPESSFPEKSISMEIWLRSLTESKNLSHIITLYDGKSPDIILIGQWKSHLVIRNRTEEAKTHKAGKLYQEIGLHNAFQKNHDTFITITSGKRRTAIYVNGKIAASYPGYRLLSGYKEGPIGLILGNSATGGNYWSGYLSGLAIYNRPLTSKRVFNNYADWIHKGASSVKGNRPVAMYVFDERKGAIAHNSMEADKVLIIPEVFKPLKLTLLHPPWHDVQWNKSFLMDVIINIIGYMPFGFFCAALLVKTGRIKINAAYLITTMLGLGLSIAIELIQVYLPTRDSSLTDLICNVIGSMLGLIVLHKTVFYDSMILNGKRHP